MKLEELLSCTGKVAAPAGQKNELEKFDCRRGDFLNFSTLGEECLKILHLGRVKLLSFLNFALGERSISQCRIVVAHIRINKYMIRRPIATTSIGLYRVLVFRHFVER